MIKVLGFGVSSPETFSLRTYRPRERDCGHGLVCGGEWPFADDLFYSACCHHGGDFLATPSVDTAWSVDYTAVWSWHFLAQQFCMAHEIVVGVPGSLREAP